MHDILGNAGMLRGWATMWTLQIIWLLAALTGSVGIVALAEQVFKGRGRRMRFPMPPFVQPISRLLARDR